MGAAELLRSVGLMADGPSRGVVLCRSAGPGMYIVEWPEPLEAAPVELTLVGKWLERLPAMRMDGERPTSREVAARLHGFWLPNQTILYIGMTHASIGGRVGALYRTPLGDRKPHAGGHWLKTLRGLDRARIWWAQTPPPRSTRTPCSPRSPAGVDASPEAAPRLADRAVILPFANLQTATDVRKAHGLTGAVEPAPPALPVPGTTVVDVPEGAADGRRRIRHASVPSRSVAPAAAATDRTRRRDAPPACAARRRGRTSARSTRRSRRSPVAGSSAS